MKPSRYTFLVVPDHDGKNRRFSISRAGTLIILFTTILLITGMVFGLIYMFPKAVDYSRMKKDYNAVIGERSKSLERQKFFHPDLGCAYEMQCILFAIEWSLEKPR